MMEDIERAKKLLESKGYTVKRGLLFEGLDESDVSPLSEFLDLHGSECSWDMSLEESLDSADLSGNQTVEYKVGDIIMPKAIYSPSSRRKVAPHRILLIYSKRGDSGIIRYKGFLLSSKVEKSNKYGGYPNNIYIFDYATILYKGAIEHKEAYICVNDIVEFTNADLDTSGVWKGTVSNKFFRFVNNCYLNYKQGIDNKYRYWKFERRYTNGRDRKETARETQARTS